MKKGSTAKVRILRSFACICIITKDKYNEKPKRTNGQTFLQDSPGKTVPMNEEELSRDFSDKCHDERSQKHFNVGQATVGMPSHLKETSQTNTFQSAGTAKKLRLSWRERTGGTWRRILSRKKQSCQTLLGKIKRTSSDGDDEVMEATSISPNQKPALKCVIQPSSIEEEVECVSTVVKQMDDNALDEKRQISLRKFLEDKNRTLDSLHQSATPLGEISAQDSCSVDGGGVSLAVSYDDNYAQLVIQASSSSSGTSAEIKDIAVLDEKLLGIEYPHPASQCGSSTARIREREHKKIWSEMDGKMSEVDISAPASPVLLEKNSTESTEWNQGWSFSHDEDTIAIASFSSALGTQVYKPISRMATGMPIPTSLCSSNNARSFEEIEIVSDASSFSRPSLHFFADQA